MSRQAIYLAGKISKNGWRETVVDRVAAQEAMIEEMAERNASYWPRNEKAVVGYFDYVGPYFTACDHGCAHQPVDPMRENQDPGWISRHCLLGGLHGVANGMCLEATPAGIVRDLCLGAIHRADFLVAWIDSLDCYGTLLEIGYALGLETPVVVALAPGIEPRELWLTLHSARLYGWFESPKDALIYLRARVDREGFRRVMARDQGCVRGEPPLLPGEHDDNDTGLEEEP